MNIDDIYNIKNIKYLSQYISSIPFDKDLSVYLPNIINNYKINNISELVDNERYNNILNINKFNNLYFNKMELVNSYMIINKIYNKNKLVDTFFLLKKRDNKYYLIQTLEEFYNLYDINYNVSDNINYYETLKYNKNIIKVFKLNNILEPFKEIYDEYNWASLYEIVNLNKFNNIEIDKNVINIISNNIVLFK
jgi:hypothetical protein